MTATKANWAGVAGAIVTVLTYLFARFTGVVELPPEQGFADAVLVLINAVGGFAVTWIVTWVSPANKPKA